MNSTTPSTARSMLLDYEADNRPLTTRADAVFTGFVSSAPRHARLLNTLSLLEHLGSRKIMVTQSGVGLEQETLKHLAEETRHAFFFKREAEKASGRTMTYAQEEMAAPGPAWMYFQRLDATVARKLGADAPARAAYLYMSLTVELRAVWAYRIYQDVLQRLGHRLSLKSLLAEEEGHLREMTADLEAVGAYSSVRVRNFATAEQQLFERFLGGLERDLAASEVAA